MGINLTHSKPEGRAEQGKELFILVGFNLDGTQWVRVWAVVGESCCEGVGYKGHSRGTIGRGGVRRGGEGEEEVVLQNEMFWL